MGFCPFLSLRKIKQVNVAARTVGGTVYESDGSVVTPASGWTLGESAVYIPSSISSATDTVVYDSTATLYNCPQNTTCQIWDDKNGRCGMRSSDLIYNGTDAAPDAIVNIIKAVVGTYSQITSGNTLVQEFQDVIGEQSDRDGTNSLLSYLKDIVGQTSEKDNSNSIYKYFQDIIGTHTEKDSTNSLINYLKSVVGQISEKDNSNSIYKYFQDILGTNSEKDDNKSLLVFLALILGANTDKDSGNSFLKQFIEIVGSMADKNALSDKWGTISSLLGSYRIINEPAGKTASSSVLIMEFLNKTDNDMIDFSSLGVVGSIYGWDFMIYESDPNILPPILKTIHTHPDFKVDDLVDNANSNCSVSVLQYGYDSTADWKFEIIAIDGTTDFVAAGVTTGGYIVVESTGAVGSVYDVVSGVKLKINMGLYNSNPLSSPTYFFILGRKRISLAEYQSMF